VKQSIQFANSDKYYCIVCEWFAPRGTQLLTNYLWLSKFLLFALTSDPPASILTNRTLVLHTYIVYLHSYIHTYVYVCLYMCVCIMYVCMCVYIYMHVCMYICICVCMHTCICMYVICMHNISGELSGGKCPTQNGRGII